jgi:hypothetical protein
MTQFGERRGVSPPCGETQNHEEQNHEERKENKSSRVWFAGHPLLALPSLAFCLMILFFMILCFFLIRGLMPRRSPHEVEHGALRARLSL